VDDWENNTDYEGYKKDDITVINFWKVIFKYNHLDYCYIKKINNNYIIYYLINGNLLKYCLYLYKLNLYLLIK